MSLDFDLLALEGFEWDVGNLSHLKRHQVEYVECESVFFNKPLVVSLDETHSQHESRFRVYGITDLSRVICLIFTTRNKKIRVISARDANRKEKLEFDTTGGDK